MLRWAAIFFIIALVAGVFGFGGIAAGAVEIAKILFFIFLHSSIIDKNMFLIICFGVLIICLNVILQSTVTVYSLKYLHKFNLKKQRLTFSEVLWQMAISVSFLTLLHGAQCTIWAATFYFNPNIDNLYSFQEAIYFSLITFTTVGYGDVVIDSEWKIMAGLEAINGIMMVGWSTALMFSYLQIILKKNITQ